MPHPKGGYKTKAGIKVPGVTTIIGRFKETGGLLHWACEQGKLIERGELTGLYDKRDQAAAAGTLAHAMVEAHIKGCPLEKIGLLPYSTETLIQAKRGFANYLQWAENTRIRVIEQEMELVSEVHLFGGCPDGIGEDAQGRICLLDWKTSSSCYVDHLTQLAGYAILWDEHNPDRVITGGFHLGRFSKESADFHHHYWSELDEAKEMFLLLRRAYDLDKNLKKRL
jgi:hypothetical protein